MSDNFLAAPGSDAGISAALRAREMRTDVEVTVVVADAYPNFSICGLPFYLSGETPDWHQLAHRTLQELEDAGLRLLLNHSAVAIDPERHEVSVEDRESHATALPYERLVIATGAVPISPPIVGLDLPGVYVLHTMDDSFRIHDHIESRHVRDVAIVGSGYIGLEMADALTHRGARVTLFGRAETVLPSVDRPLGLAIADELRRHGVAVHAGVAVEAIELVGSA